MIIHYFEYVNDYTLVSFIVLFNRKPEFQET